ncbi:hypothetical protein [Methanosphaera sp. BMS]|uniref:hypothetical protein n=1 Tax=Methanosphaera sp. BMS TaxID=1789762 RepID=UPI000DC1EA0F|nr:hypothetical protein [Methanosphaera sp. BMS]AWX32136.1 hypothetical protein AW729_03050 [Methanosphaera sp. BMS]
MASRLATFIVGFILPGLGYLFSKNYLFAIGIFLVCVFLGLFHNPIASIGSFVLWLYALIDADRKVQQINAIE